MSALFDLTGRVAVVTGGGLGIGRAIALGFAEHCANVVVCDINDEALAEIGALLTELGSDGGAIHADIADAADIRRLFAFVDELLGHVDILVNNVGIGARFHPEDLPLADFERVMRTGVTGSLLCSQEAGRRMIARGAGGSIINTSSIAGATAIGRGNLAHSVNKSAVNMLTKELAVEWAQHRIRVNAILPCQVLTEGFQTWLDSPAFDPALMDTFLKGIPMNRLATAADMVGPAVFLASDASAMVTGTLLGVDGGNLAFNAGGSHTWLTA